MARDEQDVRSNVTSNSTNILRAVTPSPRERDDILTDTNAQYPSAPPATEVHRERLGSAGAWPYESPEASARPSAKLYAGKPRRHYRASSVGKSGAAQPTLAHPRRFDGGIKPLRPRVRPSEAVVRETVTRETEGLHSALRSDVKESIPPPQERTFIYDFPSGMSMDEDSEIWPVYVKEATEFDGMIVKGWNDTVDVFLFFAALFSAVLTAFVLVSYTLLQPDNTQATVDGLVAVSQQLALMSLNTQSTTLPFARSSFSPSSSALWINALWLASLLISLFAAVVGMLVKQWLRVYMQHLPSTPRMHARARQTRYMGILKWQVPGIVNSLPLFIHMAVFLFFAGLVPFVWTASVVLGILVAAFLGVTLLLYMSSAVLPLLYASCPFRSPFSAAILPLLSRIYRLLLRLHAWGDDAHAKYRDVPIRVLTLLERPWFFCKCVLWRYNWIIRGYLPWSDDGQQKIPSSEHDQSIDAHSLRWLSATTSKPKVQEESLLALVGSWLAEETWSEIKNDIITGARSIIAMDIAVSHGASTGNGRVEERLLSLSALSTLLGHEAYPMTNDSRHVILTLARGRAETRPQVSLLAFAFLLYTSGHAHDDLLLSNTITRWAVNYLPQALKQQQVSLFGYGLVLEYYSRHVPMVHAHMLLLPISRFMALATNIPLDFICLSLYFMGIRSCSFTSCVSNSRTDLVIALLQKEDPLQVWTVYLTDKEKAEIYQNIMFCLARNAPSLDPINGSITQALCSRLPCIQEARREPGLATQMGVDWELKTGSATLTALTALMGRSKNREGWETLAVAKLLLLFEPSNPVLNAACKHLCEDLQYQSHGKADFLFPYDDSYIAFFAPQNEPLYRVLVLDGTLDGLVRCCHLQGDSRCAVATTIVQKCFPLSSDDIVLNCIIESGWLGMVHKTGLQYAFESDNVGLFADAIFKLSCYRYPAVRSSRVMEELEGLHRTYPHITINDSFMRFMQLLRRWRLLDRQQPRGTVPLPPPPPGASMFTWMTGYTMPTIV